MRPAPMNDRTLPRSFYARKTEDVARDLLGKHLVHVTEGVQRRGRIVEVEAYVGAHDLASHSSRGITGRTATMYGEPGHAYVYLIYGMHHCMNVVTEPAGHGSAVLLRALEPVSHIEGNTRGPGLLCRAMNIDRRLNGHDLLSETFFLAEDPQAERFAIEQSARIGVAYAGTWAAQELRFFIKGNRFVSGKRRS